MGNNDLRLYASGHGVRLWEVAKALGISDNTLTRRMRKDMTEDERREFLRAVDQISNGGGDSLCHACGQSTRQLIG